MNKRFVFKIVTIFLLMILLMIPLTMIEDVVSERSYFRDQASDSIAESWTGAQKVLGPVLVVPYTEQYEEKVWDENLKGYKEEMRTEAKQLFILPEMVKIGGGLRSEERTRGLYTVPVYTADLSVAGVFSNERILKTATESKHDLTWEKAYLTIVVSDTRGVVTQPKLNWAGSEVIFMSGSGIAEQGNGMHADLGLLETSANQEYAFDFAVTLHGMETLEFAPVGNSTSVALKADWPHPSFIGRYLPEQREISDTAFTADWKISSFSSDMPRLMDKCRQGNCNPFMANTFGVSLVNPVDIYQQTERSVKYALLFIILTFVAFFLFEVMKELRLHPMQYLLVGMALTVFYLLLISLSEHVDFAWAYLGAALASSVLVGVYISAVLHSAKRAMAFTGVLWLLYAMLYAILRSEDNALLMGSLLLFGVLALVMMVTRKLDWYQISDQMARQGLQAKRPQA